jgi:hypothetical protein
MTLLMKRRVPTKGFCCKKLVRTLLETSTWQWSLLSLQLSLGPVRLRRMRYEGVVLELIWKPYVIWRLLFGRYGDFSIWSYSMSAAASNSQAIPYMVVEMELLASYQYGGPNSIFIYQTSWSSARACARSPTPPSMPPPPPPPATILLR